MPSGHESLFDVPQFKTIEKQQILLIFFLHNGERKSYTLSTCVSFLESLFHVLTYFFVFIPCDTFGRQHEPIISRATFHDTQIMDTHIALPNHLITQFMTRFVCIFGCLLRAVNTYYPQSEFCVRQQRLLYK
jgi:hypothetical protein